MQHLAGTCEVGPTIRTDLLNRSSQSKESSQGINELEVSIASMSSMCTTHVLMQVKSTAHFLLLA